MHYTKNRQHGNVNIDNAKIKTNKNISNSKFDPNDISGMTISGKTFEVKNIKGYSKEVIKLTGHLKQLEQEADKVDMPELKQPKIEQSKLKITGFRGNISENVNPDVNSFNLWETLRTKIEQIKPAIQQFVQSLRGVGTNSKELELVKYKISEIEEKLEKAKNGEIHLNTKQIIEAEAELERLNNKKQKLEGGNKGNFFSSFFSSLKKVTPSMKDVAGITVKIKNTIKQWSGGLKNGLGHVLKYAGALFSLRTIYSTLSSSASSWLLSQNAGAKQLSANIDYMKNSLGSALAPVITYITNLIYNMMKAIQSVIYALFRVNIFANASSKAYSAMAGSAKNAKEETKQLAGVHDEINNVQSNDSSDSGSSSPSFDLSQMDNTPNSIIDAIKSGNWYEVGTIIGQKLNDAMSSIPWDKIQETVRNIGTGIAQTLNGFIATTDWNQIGNTFAQGLNTVVYLGYSFVTTFDWKQFGTAIGESINGFLSNIDWATAGQTLGEGIKGIFNSVSSFLSDVDWTLIGESVKTFIQNIDWIGIWNAVKETIKSAIGSIDGILTGLFGENTATIIESIAIALELVILAIKTYNIVTAIMGVITAIATSPITLIALAIVALIAIIVLCVKHWEEIKTVVMNVVNSIVEFVTNLWNQISFIFEAIWEVISTILNFIWNLVATVFEAIWNIVSPILNAVWSIISTIFQAIWNIISSILTSIWNIFSQVFNWVWQLISKVFQGIWNIISPIINKIWETIKFVLGKIQEIWSTVWNTISSVVNKVWNGIWSTIKNVVNKILGGIERFVNGTIKGINKLLSGISKVANAVGSLIGLSPINLQISTISLPRLAKGGVLTEATAIVGGEYLGAKSNPEIVTPQNIMRDTFEDVLSDFNVSNGQPLHVTIQYLGKEIFDDTIDYINSKTRRTGKNTIVTVGD